MTGEAILTLQGLRASFRTRTGLRVAVDGIDLAIHPGKILCLVGESGSGKSVTALSILRLLDPKAVCEGQVHYRGQELLSLPERSMRKLRGGKIAMIFQEPATSLHPVKTIGAQIAEAVRLHRELPRHQVQAEVLRLLEEVRVPDPARIARQYPHELSGGLKQRAMIAMALAGAPELILADEPTTALDVTVQAEILRLLARLRAERALAVLLITHDLGVVAEIADDVAVMYSGRIVEQAPAETLFANPRHPYTAGLLRSIPRIDDSSPPIPIKGSVPDPAKKPSGCRFRDRCPIAGDICQSDPPWRTIGESSFLCWREEEKLPTRSAEM